jgi:hypothetical protein
MLKVVVASDFGASARFRVCMCSLLMEVGIRRVLHYNVTAHPTAA